LGWIDNRNCARCVVIPRAFGAGPRVIGNEVLKFQAASVGALLVGMLLAQAAFQRLDETDCWFVAFDALLCGLLSSIGVVCIDWSASDGSACSRLRCIITANTFPSVILLCSVGPAALHLLVASLAAVTGEITRARTNGLLTRIALRSGIGFDVTSTNKEQPEVVGWFHTSGFRKPE